MLLFFPLGLGAGAIVAICFVPIVFITVVALFIYKQYHQRDTAVAKISKQPIVGDQTAKRKRMKEHECTNRASPSLVLDQIDKKNPNNIVYKPIIDTYP